MRRLEQLIREARSRSLNNDYSATVGIPQEDFITWANMAQDRAFSEVIKTHPTFFESEEEISAVASQEAYSVTRLYLGKTTLVEFSPTGAARDYYPLDKASLKERASEPVNHPSYYIRKNSSFLSVPPPQSGSPGKFRVTYVEKRPRLEIRRGQIQAVTTLNGAVTALTLKTAGSSALTTLDLRSQLANYNYLCIVDRAGNLKMRGLEYDSINTGTGVVTITDGAFTYATGETIAVDDFVVLGENSVNLPQIPTEIERYLIECMIKGAQARDSNTDIQAAMKECDDMLADIVSAFADVDNDVSFITVLNTDMMDGL